MAWTWMQVEVIPDDRLIRPVLGPDGLTRDEAFSAVQDLLDGQPALAPIAARWRLGAKDDTVYVGLRCWTIIEYDSDPRRAALVWLETYAATMRGAGLDVQVAQLPD
jgi:hypothetical protein